MSVGRIFWEMQLFEFLDSRVTIKKSLGDLEYHNLFIDTQFNNAFDYMGVIDRTTPDCVRIMIDPLTLV